MGLVPGTEFDDASRTIVGVSFSACVELELSGDALLWPLAVLADGKAAALKLAEMFRRRPMLEL